MYKDVLRNISRLFGSFNKRRTEREHYFPDFDFIDPNIIKNNVVDKLGDSPWESLWCVLKNSDNFSLLLSENAIKQYVNISSKMGWRNDPLTCFTAGNNNFINVYDTRVRVNGDFFQELDSLGKERKDILYTLRPHRFGFLPSWIFGLLIDNSVAVQVNSFVEQWMMFVRIDKSSYAYFGTMPVFQRVIVLCWSLRTLMLMEDENRALIINLLKILVADITYLRTNLGLSVANNHLLIDYFGGWFIEFVLSDLVRSDNWGDYENRWLNEWDRQVYVDGAGFESSTHYHELVCEISAVYILLKNRGKRPASRLAVSRLKRMLQLQLSVTGVRGQPFHMGNSAEDPMFPFGGASGWAPGALREIYRYLYDLSISSAYLSDPSIEKAYWLLDGKLPKSNIIENKDKTDLLSFPCGGLFVLDNPYRGDRITFRTGPSRNQNIHAGHAHSDLNSICLTDGGNQVLIDSGTYTYRYNSTENGINWKKYFSSPKSHNCLVLDDVDPLGDIDGDFRFATQIAFVRENIIYRNKELFWIEGELEADNIYNGVRRGVLLIENEYWIIYDCIDVENDTPSTIKAELRFQCAGGCVVSRVGSSLNIAFGNAVTSLQLGRNVEFIDTLFGDTDPVGGWVSESYGVLNKSPQIILKVKDIASPSLIMGRFSSQSQRVSRLEEVQKDGIYIATIVTPEYEDRLIMSLNYSEIDMSHYVDLDVRASMLWIRRKNGVVEKAFVSRKGNSENEQRQSYTAGVTQLNV